MRGLRLIFFLGMAALPAARGGQMADLARIHTEVIGGARLAACRALRAVGYVSSAGRDLAFELVAARPNRVRVTLRSDGRTLVQATDGVSPPWQWDSETSPLARRMNEEDGREFNADAEFDDPLSSPADRGFVLDYAGETPWQGQRVFKVLVTRGDSAPSFLLVDPETYFILARLTTQRLPSGRETTIETRYRDFRPVAGTIFPHRIEVRSEGKLRRETVLSSVHMIPEPPAGFFTMPAGPMSAPP